MGRITRAKAAEIENVHINQDALPALPSDAQETANQFSTPDAEERPPLSELAPNSTTNAPQREELEDLQKKPAKGRKGGKKGAKASKKNLNGSPLGHSTNTPSDLIPDIIPDDIESVPSPASRAASDDLMKDEPERKCLCISTCPPRGHMTLMQGCAYSPDVSFTCA